MRKYASSLVAIIMFGAICFGTVLGICKDVYAAETGYSASTAIQLSFGMRYTKSWSKNNDSLHCYNLISVPQDGYITVHAEKAIDSAGKSGDMKYILYDITGKEMFEVNTRDLDSILDSVSYNVGVAAGKYYLDITPSYSVLSGVLTAGYSIDFTETATYEKELNDDASCATYLPFDTYIEGTVRDDDVDYYWFECGNKMSVKLTMTNWSIIDDDYTSFKVNKSDGSSKNIYDFVANPDGSSSIVFDVPAGKNYFIIDSYGGKMHDYQVKIEKTSGIGDVVEIDGIKYKLQNNGECLIVGATKKTVVIPEKITCNNKSYYAKLTSESFKNNKTIETVCFDYGLQEDIPVGCFMNCSNLKVVKTTSDSSYYKSIGKKAFYGCKKLNNIKMFYQVEKIGESAFENCVLLNRINFRYVETIGKNAFKNCKKLTVIDLSNDYQLTSVGTNAFKGISGKAKIKVPYLEHAKKIYKKGGQNKSVKIYYQN